MAPSVVSGLNHSGESDGQHPRDLQMSTDEVKKQRRRLQNRKNQRARRLRLEEQRDAAEAQGPHSRPYRIKRWRVDAESQGQGQGQGQCKGHAHALPSQSEAVISTVTEACHRREPLHPWRYPISPRGKVISKRFAGRVLENLGQDTYFPLSADHLLHIIQFNVLRALMTNKNTIHALSLYSKLYYPGPEMYVSLEDCWVTAVRAVAHRDRPHRHMSLTPTQLQTNRQHPRWIGMIPWPKVRDTLLEQHTKFDHWEFILGLVGEEPEPGPPSTQGSGVDRNDDVTFEHQGLIVWGEPHDAGSWEVTPGFLAKWTWVFAGCNEVIDISNRWRAARDADPLPMSMVG